MSIRTLLLVCLTGLLSLSLPAQTLDWAGLVSQPEHWPQQCTIKKALQFQGGRSVKAGDKLNVIELSATEIVVESLDGRLTFAASPADTDALAVANAAYAALAPAARALTYAEILRRPELWPSKVALRQSFDVGRHRFSRGDLVQLMNTDKGELVVSPTSLEFTFTVKPQDTDLLDQARRFAASKTGAPGRLAEDLEGKLIDAATGAARPFTAESAPRYYVMLQGAAWCPYTREFMPKMLSFYHEQKTRHPEFEVVYIPNEKTPAELQQYAREQSFPWPVVDFRQRQKLPTVTAVARGSGLPTFWVMDRHGRVLLDSRRDREAALAAFADLLDQPAAN